MDKKIDNQMLNIFITNRYEEISDIIDFFLSWYKPLNKQKSNDKYFFYNYIPYSHNFLRYFDSYLNLIFLSLIIFTIILLSISKYFN